MAQSRRHLALFLLLAIVNITLCYLVIGLDMDFIYAENSWMENIQAIILIICSCVFAYRAFQFSDRHKYIAFLFAILCFTFAFREVDIDRLDMPKWLIFMLAEEGRGFFFLVAFFFLGMILKDSKHYFRNLKVYVKSTLALYITVSALCLILLSEAFDKKILNITYRVFFEELSELVAYCLLLATALDLKRCLNTITRTLSHKQR